MLKFRWFFDDAYSTRISAKSPVFLCFLDDFTQFYAKNDDKSSFFGQKLLILLDICRPLLDKNTSILSEIGHFSLDICSKSLIFYPKCLKNETFLAKMS